MPYYNKTYKNRSKHIVPINASLDRDAAIILYYHVGKGNKNMGRLLSRLLHLYNEREMQRGKKDAIKAYANREGPFAEIPHEPSTEEEAVIQRQEEIAHAAQTIIPHQQKRPQPQQKQQSPWVDTDRRPLSETHPSTW